MAWALVELETPKLLQQCLLPSALWTAVLSSGCLESPSNCRIEQGQEPDPIEGLDSPASELFQGGEWFASLCQSLPVSASLCQRRPSQCQSLWDTSGRPGETALPHPHPKEIKAKATKCTNYLYIPVYHVLRWAFTALMQNTTPQMLTHQLHYTRKRIFPMDCFETKQVGLRSAFNTGS